jgi:hypothetical protein
MKRRRIDYVSKIQYCRRLSVCLYDGFFCISGENFSQIFKQMELLTSIKMTLLLSHELLETPKALKQRVPSLQKRSDSAMVTVR